MIDQIRSGQSPGVGPATPFAPPANPRGVGGAFGDELAAAASERSLQLSGHAIRRLEQRRIGVDDDQLDRLRKAMDTLASKGSRQSLVMLDQVAYVVHVPTNTVVTAVAPDAGKESVFTQIDSVVIA